MLTINSFPGDPSPARRRAWPWPTPENVALESSSSGTESGWATKKISWENFGGQSMGKAITNKTKHMDTILSLYNQNIWTLYGLEAMNIGKKNTILMWTCLLDFLAKWYRAARGQDLRSAPVVTNFTSTSGRFSTFQQLGGSVPSGKLTYNYGKSPYFNGKIHSEWPFSIAMLVITRG